MTGQVCGASGPHLSRCPGALGILEGWIPQCEDLLPVPICLAVLQGILERWIPQCADLPVPICLAVLPGILERWILK